MYLSPLVSTSLVVFSCAKSLYALYALFVGRMLMLSWTIMQAASGAVSLHSLRPWCI